MDLLDACRQAFNLLISGNADLWRIIGISLRVAITGLVLATPLAIVVGFVFATYNFPGRRAGVIVLQTLLSFPTVVVGLMLYLLLTRNGPLGSLHLLFTQEAMILGEA